MQRVRSAIEALLTHIPKRLQYSRLRTPERLMIKARILFMVVQENMLLHSLLSCIHAASLITYAKMNMICSDARRAGLETLYPSLLISIIE